MGRYPSLRLRMRLRRDAAGIKSFLTSDPSRWSKMFLCGATVGVRVELNKIKEGGGGKKKLNLSVISSSEFLR